MLPFFFCGMDAIDTLDGIDVFECPVPVRESVIVLSVPSAFATIKGLKGILADDSADSSDSAQCPTSDPVTTKTSADTKGTAVYDVCWVMPVGPFSPFRPSLHRLCTPTTLL